MNPTTAALQFKLGHYQKLAGGRAKVPEGRFLCGRSGRRIHSPARLMRSTGRLFQSGGSYAESSPCPGSVVPRRFRHASREAEHHAGKSERFPSRLLVRESTVRGDIEKKNPVK